MNSRPASSEREIFQQEFVSFSDIPDQSKLFIDYQNNSEKLKKFYPTKNINFSNFAQEVLAEYKVDRKKLCEALIEENKSVNAGEKTFENIKKLGRADTFAVITGQQAGLFSGPVYTIYKALSAIKLAEKLSDAEIAAVPVFWIASEDHDFEEISKTQILDADGKLITVESKPENLSENKPVGFIETDETIKKTIDEFFASIPQTEFSKNISRLINNYEPGKAYDKAFGRILADIFSDYGLIFVSALNENLRSLSSTIFADAIENFELISRKLLNRNSELKKENYHTQVLVENDFFPFFYITEENKRKSLRFDEKSGKIKSQDSRYEFTKDELKSIAENSPQKLSPNALLRPVVQDYLFPTVCYFGGGAEIAYFGQNSVIYELLKRPVTPIRHRASFTVIEGKHRRTLEKYDLDFRELFRGKKEVSAQIIEKYLNPETSEVFTEVEKIINTQLNYLDRHLHEDNPTLSDNLENRRRKIIWHIDALRKKFHRAEEVKNQVIYRRIENLFTSLLPDDGLQERSLNVLYFLNLYGENFIEWLYNAVDTDEKKHQLIIF